MIGLLVKIDLETSSKFPLNEYQFDILLLMTAQQCNQK